MLTYEEYIKQVKSLPFGKTVGQNIYILYVDLASASSILSTFVSYLCEKSPEIDQFNVIKFFLNDFKISFLSYPTFWEELHPVLESSVTINLRTGKTRKIDYSENANPPILHRKETLTSPKRSEFELFRQLTKKEEELGLFKHANTIGFLAGWRKELKRVGVEINGNEIHKTREPFETSNTDNKKNISRHKTAISRNYFSKPVQLLLQHNLISEKQSFFDYGCGQGDDIRALKSNGIQADGWDPAHFPKNPKRQADVVNLGYVLNVIENPEERIEVLKTAYSLTNRVLAIAVLVSTTITAECIQPLGDGVVTSRNTFQKYYDQEELHQFIEDVLHTSAITVAPGIFFVFKNESDAQDFLSKRNSRRIDWNSLNLKFYPSKTERDKLKKEDILKNYRSLIESFWERMIELGRLPREEEFEGYSEIIEKIGKPKLLLDWFIEKYGPETLEKAYKNRKEDLLVYLALSNFKKKVSFSNLPLSLQTDIKSFFGSYSEAQHVALKELYKIGDPDEIEQLSNNFGKGVLDEQALFIHKSLLNELPPVLRMYVGTAGLLYGDIESVDIIKIHKRSGKVTFLIYDDFDNKELPELHWRIKVELPKQKIDFFNHTSRIKPQLMKDKGNYY